MTSEANKHEAARQMKRYRDDPVHREKVLARNRAQYVKHRDRRRARNNAAARERYTDPEHRAQRLALKRARVHGLTTEQVVAMHAAQRNACGICGAVFGEGTRSNIDHCHETDRVRGLLCSPCNKGLGHFGDSLPRVQQAVEYLQQTSASLILAYGLQQQETCK